MFYNEVQDSQFERRLKDWEEIEELIMTYQEQFTNPTVENKEAGIIASKELLERFNPLFKKYINLLKTGDINWGDMESRNFISMFIDNKDLQIQCRRKFQTNAVKQQIVEKFNFIKEMCSNQSEAEIKSDLQILLLILAKRYKQVGRNFCSYVYNCYQYEVSRFLKKQTSNPLNFNYKVTQWTEVLQNDIDLRDGLMEINDVSKELDKEVNDIPNQGWMTGETCSKAFSDLSVLDRKILVKYYLEEWKDKQIAEEFCMHINTVNQRRRKAAKKIAETMVIDIEKIKRTRKSGKKAILPT